MRSPRCCAVLWLAPITAPPVHSLWHVEFALLLLFSSMFLLPSTVISGSFAAYPTASDFGLCGYCGISLSFGDGFVLSLLCASAATLRVILTTVDSPSAAVLDGSAGVRSVLDNAVRAHGRLCEMSAADAALAAGLPFRGDVVTVAATVSVRSDSSQLCLASSDRLSQGERALTFDGRLDFWLALSPTAAVIVESW